MCDPIVLGIVSGVGSAVTGIAEQNRQHRAQVDAVNRSNAIARQKYLNDIQISAYNDQRKGEVLQLSYKLMLRLEQILFKQKRNKSNRSKQS